ncbi:hypothetical protein V8B97DRAFT_1992492 [Scleroderma yunnanense]
MQKLLSLHWLIVRQCVGSTPPSCDGIDNDRTVGPEPLILPMQDRPWDATRAVGVPTSRRCITLFGKGSFVTQLLVISQPMCRNQQLTVGTLTQSNRLLAGVSRFNCVLVRNWIGPTARKMEVGSRSTEESLRIDVADSFETATPAATM